MVVDHASFGKAAFLLASVLACALSPPSSAAEAKARTQAATLSAAPGTLVR